MKICRLGAELSTQLSAVSPKQNIGFVPTMGALHQGHLSLVEKAKKLSDYIVVSIFINPTQFNNKADFEAYPIDTDVDLKMLQDAGVDLVFLPEVSEMYPEATVSEHYELGILEQVMEGGFRAGHFQGVATIVDRLFDLVKPNLAFFGEKDFQQIAVIQRMVELKGHQIEIIPCENIRETDGLAMSSRNRRLNEDQRSAAPKIYQALSHIAQQMHRRKLEDLKEEAKKEIESSEQLSLEYLEIVDEKSFKPIQNWSDSERPRAFVAAYAGNTRLIDNLRLK